MARLAPTSMDPTDPEMTFPFIGGSPCLNFVATLGRRHTNPLERLTDSGALARWFTEAHLQAGPDRIQITAKDLNAARMLREALYRVLRAAMTGNTPDPADAARINESAAHPDLAPQLADSDTCTDSAAGTGGRRPVLHWQAAHPARAALATVARDAVLLVSGSRLDRVKECENPECSLLFLDDSQARRRRWCSMERCGNLVKVAGYRSRRRSAS